MNWFDHKPEPEFEPNTTDIYIYKPPPNCGFVCVWFFFNFAINVNSWWAKLRFNATGHNHMQHGHIKVNSEFNAGILSMQHWYWMVLCNFAPVSMSVSEWGRESERILENNFFVNYVMHFFGILLLSLVWFFRLYSNEEDMIDCINTHVSSVRFVLHLPIPREETTWVEIEPTIKIANSRSVCYKLYASRCTRVIGYSDIQCCANVFVTVSVWYTGS